MGKRVTEMDDHGRIVTYRATSSRRKSEQRLIGWTPGPQTKWQKFKRSAVG